MFIRRLYEVISELISHIGLDIIQNRLLLDLVIIRIMEPASKLRSIELLDVYFGIKHRFSLAFPRFT